MPGTARRIGDGLGTDTVRRLIARPIRTHIAGAAHRRPGPVLDAPVPFEPTPDALAPLDRSAPIGAEPEDDGETGEAVSLDVARLQTELRILKAVISAERREVASLRACIGLDAAEAELGAEARALRDRWAALVDRLIHEAR